MRTNASLAEMIAEDLFRDGDKNYGQAVVRIKDLLDMNRPSVGVASDESLADKLSTAIRDIGERIAKLEKGLAADKQPEPEAKAVRALSTDDMERLADDIVNSCGAFYKFENDELRERVMGVLKQYAPTRVANRPIAPRAGKSVTYFNFEGKCVDQSVGIIDGVHSDSAVDLSVFKRHDAPWERKIFVRLFQPYNKLPAPEGHYCVIME